VGALCAAALAVALCAGLAELSFRCGKGGTSGGRALTEKGFGFSRPDSPLNKSTPGVPSGGGGYGYSRLSPPALLLPSSACAVSSASVSAAPVSAVPVSTGGGKNSSVSAVPVSDVGTGAVGSTPGISVAFSPSRGRLLTSLSIVLPSGANAELLVHERANLTTLVSAFSQEHGLGAEAQRALQNHIRQCFLVAAPHPSTPIRASRGPKNGGSLPESSTLPESAAAPAATFAADPTVQEQQGQTPSRAKQQYLDLPSTPSATGGGESGRESGVQPTTPTPTAVRRDALAATSAGLVFGFVLSPPGDGEGAAGGVPSSAASSVASVMLSRTASGCLSSKKSGRASPDDAGSAAAAAADAEWTGSEAGVNARVTLFGGAHAKRVARRPGSGS